MKKTLLLALSLMLCLSVFAGCNQPTPSSSQDTPTSSDIPDEPTELNLPETVRVSAMSGPTAMGMVKLMQDDEDGTTGVDYTFAIGTTDELVPLISKGEIDIAAVPANLASVLYNNTEGKIEVLAINTLGVLYVVEKGETIQSVADLAGKTILATGMGATPEYSLKYVLSQNDIDPETGVAVDFKSEAAEILPLLMQGEGGIAFIPQPFVTNALSRVEGLRIALNWTEEWDKVSEDSGLVTGVVVVQKSFLEAYPDAVELFMQEYAASTAYAQTNVEETGELVGKYGIVDAAIAKQALPYCNITCITGTEMQDKLSGYLTVLYDQNPASVGGTLPDEGFYYLG